MSIRAIGVRILNHGRALVLHCAKRNINTAIGDKINNAVLQPTARTTTNVVSPKNFALRHVGAQLGLQARRILIDNVLNRVTNSLSGDLRKKATRRILFGDSRPFFALVGVSLASGTGILTKEDELEGVCWEIREAISRVKWSYYDPNTPLIPDHPESLSLNDLSVGKAIAKGANGVVCTATLRSLNSTHNGLETNTANDIDNGTFNTTTTTDPSIRDIEHDPQHHPYALKMLYNYDIRSNSMEILKAMYRETVPSCVDKHEDQAWELEMAKRRKRLPPHPNIVAIHAIFTDFVREFDDCKQLCPAALPPRIHSGGEGRNMSLFILMKRYDCNLQTFLQQADGPLPKRMAILLFAQLLEGIAHMINHGIAHRDLKADNLLLDTREPDSPILVISDFGCCLADTRLGLTVPYNSWDVDKGGNVALMAPEIYTQEPGTFSVLNYAKADLWAAATIAYELFGCGNPAYGWLMDGSVKSKYIVDELPQLPDDVPHVVRKLVANLLQRNPNKRLEAEVAANVCQLFLWAPSSWLRSNTKLPSSAEILQWLLSLTTKLLCENRLQSGAATGENANIPAMQGRRTFPEYLLIASFLARAKLCTIRTALTWMHDQDY